MESNADNIIQYTDMQLKVNGCTCYDLIDSLNVMTDCNSMYMIALFINSIYNIVYVYS